MNSSVFVKGQVWYWEDPIYGKKQNNYIVETNEVTTRYSRYCIIMQNTDTISSSSILVIPCSTVRREHDIKVTITHVNREGGFNNSYTYAKIEKIFPVHADSLKRYVCTLSNDSIRDIENRINELLINSYDEYEENDSYDSTLLQEVPVGTKKWSDEMKGEFVKYFKENGPELTAKKYHLTIGTTKVYWYRWSRIDSSDSSDKSDKYITVPSYDLETGILKISNIICTTLKKQDIYDVIGYIYKNGKIVNKTCFYYNIKKVIVESLIKFIGGKAEGEIRIRDMQAYEYEFVNTIHLLNKISTDETLINSRGISILRKYRDIYDEKGGISKKWIEFFIKEVKNTFVIEDISVNILVDGMKEIIKL